MAFPTVAGRTNSQTTADSTSHTVNFDTTPTDGDLLIVMVVFDGTPTITWPTGWIQVATADNGAIIRTEIRYRVASSNGSSIALTTGTSEEMQARAWRIQKGSFSSNPAAQMAALRSSGNGTSPNPPSLSPSWGAADTLWFVFCGTDAAAAASAYPTNYSQTGTANSGGAGGVGIGYGERAFNSATDDPSAFTISLEDYTVWTVALNGIQAVSPSALALVTTFPNVGVAQRTFPSALALVASFSAPTVRQIANPAALALVAVFPPAAVAGTQFVSPTALALAALFPTVNVIGRLHLSPFPLAVTFPTVQVNIAQDADAFGVAAVFPATVVHQITLPASLALAAVLPAPTVSAIAPPEPPAPMPSVGTDVDVRIYDGESGASLGMWTNVTALNITFGVHGPETATVGLARIVDGELNPALHYRRLMPGFRGVFVEVDARALGIEEVWLGRATNAPVGSTQAEVQVSCQGPNRILERESVPAASEFMTTAGAAVLHLLADHPTPLRVLPDTFEEGPVVVVSLGGASLWEAITTIEDLSLGRVYFVGVPGRVQWRASYRSQIVPTPDERGRVVLDDGYNAEWDIDNDLDPGTDQLVLVGQSFADGQDNNAVRAFAPGGLVMGRRAALTATVQSAVAATVSGQGETAVRPDLAALPTLVSQVDAELRAGLYPPVVASVRVLDEGLWSKLRVGMIVETRFRKDPLGLFTRALAEVQQITWGLKPQRTCDLGVELWALAE